MWTQLYRILAVLLPIFTYVTAILHGQVVRPFFVKTCGEKNRSGAHGRSSIYFNATCFFCGIVHRYLREKSATCSPSRRPSLASWLSLQLEALKIPPCFLCPLLGFFSVWCVLKPYLWSHRSSSSCWLWPASPSACTDAGPHAVWFPVLRPTSA